MPIYTQRTGDGTPGNKPLHGGKGAGLLDMASAFLPVPNALIITTEAWKHYRQSGIIPISVQTEVLFILDAHPDSMFSVRSGAPVSMPGMMDTILNVGVNQELDGIYPGAFRRFATQWLEIVKGVGKARVKDLLSRVTDRASGDGTRFFKLLAGVVDTSEMISIPIDRFDQVMACVEAVFKSWDTPRAKAYRAMHDIPEDMGTACVVQRMVMGTAKGLSGSGVMFTRDPATGENKMRGEIAFNAQGEEVVSGAVTPLNLEILSVSGASGHLSIYKQLETLCDTLEIHFGDVQDIEFTVEDGKLYVLQTRTAKMSARARIETAVALLNNLPLAKRLPYLKARVTRGMVAQTMVATVDTPIAPHLIGLAASPGAICGKIIPVTHAVSKTTKDCILVAEDTSPDDFPVMAKAGGILTKTGGFTCHSAVVARGIGVPAVVGADELKFTATGIQIANVFLPWGAEITIDGTTGAIYSSKFEVKKAQPPRSIYTALHAIVQANGTHVNPDVYYYDCGLGKRVVLPIEPSDLERLEVQLDRAYRLKAKGKTVALAFEMQGLGEDMFDPSPSTLFEVIAKHYGPDIAGHHILYGVPKAMAPVAQALLGVTINTDKAVSVIDLLDLLG